MVRDKNYWHLQFWLEIQSWQFILFDYQLQFRYKMSGLGRYLIFLYLLSKISSQEFYPKNITIGEEYEYEIDKTKGIKRSR